MTALTQRAPFEWLNDDARVFLSRGYLLEGVTPEQRIREIAEYAGKLLDDSTFADKFYRYMGKGWYSLSSPIWSNFGLARGLPIACFSSYVPDSMDGIATVNAENMMLSKYGGGTSSYWGDVRPRGSEIKDNGKSDGAVNFLRLLDTSIDVSKQGATRRGMHAAYLPIDHGDIEEFLTIKTDGSNIQNLFYGVTITDQWMIDMINGDAYKRKVWAKVLENRKKIGLPYIFWTDNVNNNKPEVYDGLTITNSNLCTEITLPTNSTETFVCDLSSLNLLHVDEWLHTDAVAILTQFLDAVMTEFITKAKKLPYFEKAVKFAENHRALGIGVLGWHSYLQSRMIPLESQEAYDINDSIFERIKGQAYEESGLLAQRFGPPAGFPDLDRRNTTLLAIAPTTSSSFILGQVSQSVEPLRSNYYVKDLAKTKTTYRNPYLTQLLQGKEMDTPAVWRSILEHDGSVQHLTELSDNEKNVFKTFSEISQMDIIKQAADRQKYIDQAQSLNLMIHPSTPTKDINKLYIEAWSLGIKTLYYQHSINAAQEFNRELLTCVSCEG